MAGRTEPVRVEDRAAIVDLFVRYCTVLRTKNVDLLDDLFTPDGVVDYTRIGGVRAGLGDTKQWLAGLLSTVEQFHLFVGDSEFRFDAAGSAAEVTTTWHGLYVPAQGSALQIYGYYEDRVVRADDWRIAERVDCPGASVVATLANPATGAA